MKLRVSQSINQFLALTLCASLVVPASFAQDDAAAYALIEMRRKAREAESQAYHTRLHELEKLISDEFVRFEGTRSDHSDGNEPMVHQLESQIIKILKKNPSVAKAELISNGGPIKAVRNILADIYPTGISATVRRHRIESFANMIATEILSDQIGAQGFNQIVSYIFQLHYSHPNRRDYTAMLIKALSQQERVMKAEAAYQDDEDALYAAQALMFIVAVVQGYRWIKKGGPEKLTRAIVKALRRADADRVAGEVAEEVIEESTQALTRRAAAMMNARKFGGYIGPRLKRWGKGAAPQAVAAMAGYMGWKTIGRSAIDLFNNGTTGVMVKYWDPRHVFKHLQTLILAQVSARAAALKFWLQTALTKPKPEGLQAKDDTNSEDSNTRKSRKRVRNRRVPLTADDYKNDLFIDNNKPGQRQYVQVVEAAMAEYASILSELAHFIRMQDMLQDQKSRIYTPDPSSSVDVMNFDEIERNYLAESALEAWDIDKGNFTVDSVLKTFYGNLIEKKLIHPEQAEEQADQVVPEDGIQTVAYFPIRIDLEDSLNLILGARKHIEAAAGDYALSYITKPDPKEMERHQYEDPSLDIDTFRNEKNLKFKLGYLAYDGFGEEQNKFQSLSNGTRLSISSLLRQSRLSQEKMKKAVVFGDEFLQYFTFSLFEGSREITVPTAPDWNIESPTITFRPRLQAHYDRVIDTHKDPFLPQTSQEPKLFQGLLGAVQSASDLGAALMNATRDSIAFATLVQRYKEDQCFAPSDEDLSRVTTDLFTFFPELKSIPMTEWNKVLNKILHAHVFSPYNKFTISGKAASDLMAIYVTREDLEFDDEETGDSEESTQQTTQEEFKFFEDFDFWYRIDPMLQVSPVSKIAHALRDYTLSALYEVGSSSDILRLKNIKWMSRYYDPMGDWEFKPWTSAYRHPTSRVLKEGEEYNLETTAGDLHFIAKDTLKNQISLLAAQWNISLDPEAIIKRYESRLFFWMNNLDLYKHETTRNETIASKDLGRLIGQFFLDALAKNIGQQNSPIEDFRDPPEYRSPIVEEATAIGDGKVKLILDGNIKGQYK